MGAQRPAQIPFLDLSRHLALQCGSELSGITNMDGEVTLLGEATSLRD